MVSPDVYSELLISDTLVPDIFIVRYLPALSKDAVALYLWTRMTYKGGSFTLKEAFDFGLIPEEDIKTALYEADNALNGDEYGVVSQVKSAYNALNGISKVMPKTAELTERLDSCRIELKDIAEEVSQLLERTDFDPAELENINNRPPV